MVYRILVCLLISVMLPSCASHNSLIVGGACYNKSLPLLLDATDLKVLFQDIAAELCTDNCTDCAPHTSNDVQSKEACASQIESSRTTVLVTDFADLQSFLPNQSGLLMGELMRGSLNKVCCNKIVQAEFAKYFKLSEKGLVVLTRNVKEIKKDDYSQSEAIVGTYSYLNNNKLVIFVRRINIETGRITRMATREVNYTCAERSVSGYTVK